MSDFREVIQSEIEKTRRAMYEAKTRHDTLLELLAKYEQSRGSHNGDKPRTSVTSASDLIPTTSPDSDETNKTEKVVAVIMKHQAQGLKPSAVITALNDEGISIGRNYVYSVLNRLQKRGRIQNKRGKYYPALGALTTAPDATKSSAV